jgi:hypothetical protein
LSIPFNKLPCVQDNPSEIVAADDIVADSVDLDLFDAIAVLDPAEVVAAIDVLDIAEAVAAEGDLIAVGLELTDDNFDLPFAIEFKDFENV